MGLTNPIRDIDNEKRCIAAEIICHLYKSKNRLQLELLQSQIKRTLEVMDEQDDHEDEMEYKVDRR